MRPIAMPDREDFWKQYHELAQKIDETRKTLLADIREAVLQTAGTAGRWIRTEDLKGLPVLDFVHKCHRPETEEYPYEFTLCRFLVTDVRKDRDGAQDGLTLIVEGVDREDCRCQFGEDGLTLEELVDLHHFFREISGLTDRIETKPGPDGCVNCYILPVLELKAAGNDRFGRPCYTDREGNAYVDTDYQRHPRTQIATKYPADDVYFGEPDHPITGRECATPENLFFLRFVEEFG